MKLKACLEVKSVLTEGAKRQGVKRLVFSLNSCLLVNTVFVKQNAKQLELFSFLF